MTKTAINTYWLRFLFSIIINPKMDLIEKLIIQIEHLGLWKKEQNLSRNEYLKINGSTDTNLYFIVSGSLRIFVLDESEEHTIRFGYKNNFIASLDSFITEQPSDLYIQAIKKSKLKVIGKADFMKLIKSSAENLEAWQIILQQLVVQQMERERDILTSSPLKRYERVLKRSPQLFQEIPHKYIANYLRMSAETLSRLKNS